MRWSTVTNYTYKQKIETKKIIYCNYEITILSILPKSD